MWNQKHANTSKEAYLRNTDRFKNLDFLKSAILIIRIFHLLEYYKNEIVH